MAKVLEDLGTRVKTALNTRERMSQKNVANGYAGLDANGKIALAQLPAITITDTYVVASEVDMLALVVEKGDVAVRTDLSKTFILSSEPASTLANWQELVSPTSPVQSFNTRVGAVTLTELDVTDVLGTYAEFITAFETALDA